MKSQRNAQGIALHLLSDPPSPLFFISTIIISWSATLPLMSFFQSSFVAIIFTAFLFVPIIYCYSTPSFLFVFVSNPVLCCPCENSAHSCSGFKLVELIFRAHNFQTNTATNDCHSLSDPLSSQRQPSGDYDSLTLRFFVRLIFHSRTFFGDLSLSKNRPFSRRNGPLIFDKSIQQLLCRQLKGVHLP